MGSINLTNYWIFKVETPMLNFNILVVLISFILCNNTWAAKVEEMPARPEAFPEPSCNQQLDKIKAVIESVEFPRSLVQEKQQDLPWWAYTQKSEAEILLDRITALKADYQTVKVLQDEDSKRHANEALDAITEAVNQKNTLSHAEALRIENDKLKMEISQLRKQIKELIKKL